MPAVLDIDTATDMIEFMQLNDDDLHPIYWRNYPSEWLRFHAENPQVYTELKRMSFELLQRGRKKWGINSLIEVVRWQIAMNTTDPVFKINNNHGPSYARYLMDMNPELKGFFNTRQVKR